MSDSATRRTVWPNSEAISSAVSASITSPGFMIWPCFMKNLTTSTARSDMRCASSWMVMVSGSITSRMNLLARFLVQRALELLLAAAHRRQRAGARVLVGQRRVQRQLAAAAVVLALGLGGLAQLPALTMRLTGPRARPRFGLPLLRPRRRQLRSLRRAAARFFLGAAAGFGLGLQARLFLGLAARGFLALAAAALFFLGAALGVVGRALAILDLANLRAFERPAARLHLVVRQVR